MPKVAVILSGCGVMDGSEVHESVLALLALDKAGATVECLAPDKNQMHVVNHHTGKPAEGETRNVRVESARIARGPVGDLATAAASEYDAVILPGGFGAAKNLCDYATQGANCTVDPIVKGFLTAAHAQGKPIGAICISPVIIANCFGGGDSPKITIGKDPDQANNIESMGAEHISCPVDDFVVDEEKQIVTTPAYMLAQSISEAAVGIERLVKEVLKLAAAKKPVAVR